MSGNKALSHPSGVQWSTEQPHFEFAGHISPVDRDYPDRIDYGGADHALSFTSGSLDEIESFHTGIVLFNVDHGQNLQGAKFDVLADDKVITQYLARQVFPVHRQAEIRGLFKTAQAPEIEELEVFAGGLMKMLTISIPEAQS